MKSTLSSLQLPDSRIAILEHITDGHYENGRGLVCDGLPPLWRVQIHTESEPGAFTRTEIWLPEQWNGILLTTGNGGMAGNLGDGWLDHYVRQDYAVVTSDLGTSRGRDSGIHNPGVWRDFGWRATHLMAVLGKAVVEAAYGKPAAYTYYLGASTGGQQAFSAAQRFPLDYNGIVAGVPAQNRVFLHTYFLWVHTHLRDKESGPLFSEADAERLADCAADFFQAKGDGQPGDRFVSFPYVGETTVTEFIAYLKAVCPDYTQKQLDALEAVYRGPVNPQTGAQIYNGLPIGSEPFALFRSAQEAENSQFYPFVWAFGKEFDPYAFRFADDLEELSRILSPDLNANDPDLRAFRDAGGKLIASSGSSDPLVPYPDAMKYYNRVCAEMGGFGQVKDFFRYFLIPGKDHNFGGRGANLAGEHEYDRMLGLIRRWVEQGIAPDTLPASRYADPRDLSTLIFERTLYPYAADKVEGRDFPRACDEQYVSGGKSLCSSQ